MVVMPMIIPLPIANAQQNVADQAQTETQVQSLKHVANAEVVQVEQPTVEIVVTQSEYDKEQQAKNLAAQKAAAVQAAAVQVANSVPTDTDKRLLVQQAAAAFGIDWKVLEAVWQVESGKQLYTTVGSSAGARGPMQFMPGTWTKYAKDGNGDGVKNVYDARDALYAAADLLARNGAASGDNTKALFSYNHAMWYVNKVMAIANSL